MSKRFLIAAAGAAILGLSPFAYAKKDMPRGATTHQDGGAEQQIHPSRLENSNNPASGSQLKGADRADERKSEQGLFHDHPEKKTKGKGKH